MNRATIWRVWFPLMVGLGALWEIFTFGPGPHGASRWVGLVLGLSGLAMVIIARYTLGGSFSVRAKATALVTTGIYSRIRNPIYVGGVIVLIGIAVVLSKPYILAILLVVIPMQTWRARKEARVLEEKFGDEYREYRRRTWF